tara:strand:+ start:315 stop:917 length:603 start_codon:yes stop_codon:yes gene_type:complete
MIYYIKGNLALVKEDVVIIDVNGIGYSVCCPDSILSELPDIGASIHLFTYHYIREDQQLLFGFISEEERQFFMTLTTVSGVGPKLGIKILSSLSVNALTQAIIQGNLAQLTQISGVGKKMAERMVIELKDKLSQLYGMTGISVENNIASVPNALNNDLMLACKSLGYSHNEIKEGIVKAGELITSDVSLEENLKQLLKQL